MLCVRVVLPQLSCHQIYLHEYNFYYSLFCLKLQWYFYYVKMIILIRVFIVFSKSMHPNSVMLIIEFCHKALFPMIRHRALYHLYHDFQRRKVLFWSLENNYHLFNCACLIWISLFHCRGAAVFVLFCITVGTAGWWAVLCL